MRIHVAIVSEQLLPTVIPCLMAKPDLVVLVASRKMANRAVRLRAVLQEDGIPSEIHEDAPDWRLDAIRAYASKLADELVNRHAGADITFNATGGTKLMTLGFVEVFSERSARIVYTDTDHAQIEVIRDRRPGSPEREPMPNVLDVPSYLAVQGFRYQGDASRDEPWLARMEARRRAASFLARHAASLGGLIGTLNHLVNREALDEGGRNLKQPVHQLEEVPRGRWPEALRLLDEVGVLRWTEGKEIRFPDAERARFLGGGWLEEYAFASARGVGLHDVRIGVTGVWEGAESARNEFDVLACHRNKLLFMECKTAQFHDGPNDNELAYKVESLGKDTRGLFGATWVVTARRPTQVLLDRAKQAGFRIIGPNLLGALTRRIEMWKQSGV